MFQACILGVVLCPLITPWRYAVAAYLTAPGAPLRTAARVLALDYLDDILAPGLQGRQHADEKRRGGAHLRHRHARSGAQYARGPISAYSASRCCARSSTRSASSSGVRRNSGVRGLSWCRQSGMSRLRDAGHRGHECLPVRPLHVCVRRIGVGMDETVHGHIRERLPPNHALGCHAGLGGSRGQSAAHRAARGPDVVLPRHARAPVRPMSVADERA